MTGPARAAADTVLAFASDTGRARPAGTLYAVFKRCRAPADRAAAERRLRQQIVRSVGGTGRPAAGRLAAQAGLRAFSLTFSITQRDTDRQPGAM